MFSENHLIAFRDSAVSTSTSNITDFANDDNVLSSAKLCRDGFLIQKKKSIKNASNNISLKIEPFGSPKIMSLTYCLHIVNTLFTVFQIRANIFQITTIQYICRALLLVSHEGCNQKLLRNPLTLPSLSNCCHDFLSIHQVI